MEQELFSRVVQEAEVLAKRVMGQWDSSHDAFHAFRVRDLALSLASEEHVSIPALQIVELTTLLHDIDDHKYVPRGNEEHETAEQFLVRCNVPAPMIHSITSIIHKMGFKEEVSGLFNPDQHTVEFKIVQDADRLDAIGAIGIARCFTFGGSRNCTIYDPSVQPRVNLTKDEYVKQEGKNISLNHFYEKLLKLKDLMKTEAGRRRAEGRHKFMEEFLKEFHGEWEGKL
ncbi:hypothetical protein GOP47_0023857 [Adiantum capillus-veneris]|uniref:HD/PDEase domain-containing protein n=1 Tax=Adiantum capillus-veneris TaxID=13818 RepID=A0A9D4U4P5_ADICA|nr:hypothetical protein GOP47_0023857 [Adiantum capillus-veneris]